MYSFKSPIDPSVFAYPAAAKITTYAITNSDYVIPCNDTSGSFTVTLPTAVGQLGKVFWIGKINSTLTTAVTISTTSNQTITPLGATSTTINTQEEWLCVISDNANWHVLQRRIPSIWTAATVTGSWISNATYTAFYRRVGDTAQWTVQVTTSGAPTSATLTITLPSGIVIDTAKLLGGFLLDGQNVCSNDNSTVLPGGVIFQSSTIIKPVYNDTGAGGLTNITQAAPFTFGAADYVQIYFNIPVVGWNG